VAAARYLQDRHRARAVDEYVRSYAEHPETDEELEATEALLRAAWSTDDQE
jgi:hypothetical protein